MDISDLDLADVRAFFIVAETGSFARAAQRLETSKAVVSRRVARLESALSSLLLQRTQSGALLTEAGHLFYDEARTAVTQLQCAVENLKGVQADISGSIRMTVPIHFGTFILTSVLCDFMRQYPGIELDVQMSDDKVDLVRMGFDLAVRTGHLRDSALVQRRLADYQRMLVGSPAYLAASPVIRVPEDVQAHRILHYTTLNTFELWRYRADGEIRQFPVKPYLRSNSGTVLIQSAVAGLGLTVMPSYIAGPHVAAGELVRILPDVDWDTSPVSLLMPAGRRMTQRVRTLADFLVARFATPESRTG